MSFKKATVYRLKDPERYDDEEYGEGYDHVETYGDCDGMFITDCWIVNDKGKIHPGYKDSPIPVRFDDVGEETDLEAVNNERERAGFGWK